MSSTFASILNSIVYRRHTPFIQAQCFLTCSLVVFSLFCFFFFKQKTAYEMRISDWSSDVCSSDLVAPPPREVESICLLRLSALGDVTHVLPLVHKIGRASCRERVCQYV